MSEKFEDKVIGYLAALTQEMTEMRSNMATKDELAEMRNNMATKNELAEMRNNMATKNELAEMHNNMATKDDINKLEAKIEHDITDKIRALYDSREVQQDVNERIVTTLERIEAKVDVLQLETAHIRRVK